jgi:hypothetical protein
VSDEPQRLTGEIMSIFLPTFLLSSDSFFASIALGTTGVKPRHQVQLAMLFGVCDALASGFGAATGPAVLRTMPVRAETLEWWLVAYLVAVLVYCRSLGSAGNPHPWLLWTIPLALSLDNFIAPTPGAISIGTMFAIVAMSASLSLMGFRVARLASVCVGILAARLKMGTSWLGPSGLGSFSG